MNWKIIGGYNGKYSISDHGDVRTENRGGLNLKGFIDRDGYKNVKLSQGISNRKTFRVNRLVAENFVSNPENKPMVNHMDGNKLNNHFSNLEWVTCRENAEHALKHNLRPSYRGPITKRKRNGKSKLSEADRLAIKSMAEKGKLLREIAGTYKISLGYACLIIRGRELSR